MGIISFLIKLFFFYIIFMIISGLFKAYQTYKLMQQQMGEHEGSHQGARRSYAEDFSSDEGGQTIDAEFEVINEKEL